MKIAELHDGKTIIFPPDMDDAMMDAMVRAGLGIKDGPDSKEMMLIECAKAFGQFAEVLLKNQTTLIEETQQTRQSIDRLCNMVASNGEVTKQAALLNHAGQQEIATALRMTKSLIIGPDGKPTGLEVK